MPSGTKIHREESSRSIWQGSIIFLFYSRIQSNTWSEYQIFLVTGANSGVGAELAKILYGKNATVYVAARSKQKALDAIEEMKTAHPESTGRLVFLQLDLSDLTTIKSSAEEFLAAESRLDVLWLNAGVSHVISQSCNFI